MSIFNIFTLTISQVSYLSMVIGKQDLTLTSNYSCLLLTYFKRVFIQMSTWLNIIVTLERIACISCHDKFKFITHKKKLAVIIAIVFFAILVLNVPNLFFKLSKTPEYLFKENKTVIYIICTSNSSIVSIRNFEIALMRVLIPIILQITLSIILINELAKNKSKLNTNIAYIREYRFAYVIVIFNFVSAVTEAPLMLSMVHFGAIGLTPAYPISLNASRTEAIANLIYFCALSFSLYLFCFLFVFNFFINRQFRREIRIILCGPIFTQYVQN